MYYYWLERIYQYYFAKTQQQYLYVEVVENSNVNLKLVATYTIYLKGCGTGKV